MNLKEIVREVCGRTGLPRPETVINNADVRIVQMLGLLNEFCEDLIVRNVWQANKVETVHTTLAAEDQGDIRTLCPAGYNGILFESFFSRTTKLPIRGSIDEAEWQARKAFNIAGPHYLFRIRGDHLLISPAPPAGHTWAWEYKSTFFVQSEAGTPKAYWTADSDTCRVDERLPLSFLRWKWKAEKGLEYAEDRAAYERLLATIAGRDQSNQSIHVDGEKRDLTPGIFVPAGNYNV